MNQSTLDAIHALDPSTPPPPPVAQRIPRPLTPAERDRLAPIVAEKLATLATPPRELRGRHAHAPSSTSAAVRRSYNRAGTGWDAA